jgi:hypothetical protein
MALNRQTLPNGRTVTFGRTRSPKSYKGLRFSDIVNVSALPTPPKWNWNPKNQALNAEGLGNILANDRYGCCAFAGPAHIIDSERAQSGNPYTPVQAEQVLWAYSQVTGFDEATGQNDNGANLVDVLSWWQKHGYFADGSSKIVGWAAVDATNEQEVKTAAWLFDLMMGAELPSEWTRDVTAWNVVGPPNPNDGHCVVSPRANGYNSKALLVDSWGFTIPVAWAAVAKYFGGDGGEMFAVFTEESINHASGKSPNGFDAAQLTAYLKSI